jgi:hypothetical protein
VYFIAGWDQYDALPLIIQHFANSINQSGLWIIANLNTVNGKNILDKTQISLFYKDEPSIMIKKTFPV